MGNPADKFPQGSAARMVNLVDRTYYEILGVSQDASVDEIKDAYKGIARAYHPDSNFYDEIIEGGGQPGPEPDQEAFKKITEAYNTLVNEERRKEYDALFPKGLRDWDQIERGISKDEFLTSTVGSRDDLTGAIYRPRGKTGTFKRAQFGTVPTEAQESAIDAELRSTVTATTRSQAIVPSEARGRSIEPMEMPAERNIIGWFVGLLTVGFLAGAVLAYWVVTNHR